MPARTTCGMAGRKVAAINDTVTWQNEPMSELVARLRRWATWAPAVVAAMIAGWIAADTVNNMALDHVSLPFWDHWRMVSEYRDWLAGNYGVDDLFSQHNEHRIAAGRVLFFTDIFAFGGRGIFLSVCITVILGALAALLIWVARPRRRSAWRGYTVVAAAVAGCCLTFTAYENLLWPFQAPFVLLYLASAVGLYATLKASEAAKRGGRWSGWAVLAVGALAVAAYCMANGLAAAGLALALAAVLRAPPRIIAVLAITFAVLTFAYFHGYQSTGKSGALAYLVSHPHVLPTYLSMFLGNILRDYPARDATTATLGVLGLLLCLGVAWRILARRDLDPTRLFLTALLLFVLVAGLASGVGRVAEFGLSQALSSRYVTPGALFWALQALYWHSVTEESKTWPRAVAVTGAGLLLVLLIGAQVGARKDAAGLQASMSREADALLVGVTDTETQLASTPLTLTIAGDTALLRAHDKSIYAEPEAHWMGRRLADLAEPDGACLGAIDLAARAPDDPRGLRLTGWSWDVGHDRRVERLVVVNSAGRIVGLASGGSYRPDVTEAVRAVDHVASGWRGFATGNPGDILSVYGLVGSHRTCTLGTVTATP